MRSKLLLTLIIAVASLALTTTDKVKETLAKHLGITTLVSTHGSPDQEIKHGGAAHDPSASEAALHGSTEHEGHGEAEHSEGEHHLPHKVVVTSPVVEDVTLTQRYVCQIHSRRHIDVCALEGGYLEDIKVNEGQFVKKGELMFKILPTLYQATLDADLAERQLAQVEYDNMKSLVDQKIVSDQKLKLAEAKLSNAQAKVEKSQAELDFTNIRAPFDGIVDKLHEFQGSLIEEGDMLTTLSDNSVMWVYFPVPEARYLEYQKAMHDETNRHNLEVSLMLANHKKFSQLGRIGAIEADFNNETGNIAFRADFPNPEGLLRHGQTGTILIDQVEKGAIVIPQRAKYEILAKTYVYVVDEENVVHQREIVIQNEKDDIYVIASGLNPGERIVLEGLRQVRDGEKIEYEYLAPEVVLSNLKYHAE